MTVEGYEGLIETISDEMAEDMRGKSWRDDPRCPAVSGLALLCLPYRAFDGRDLRGELVVAREHAPDIVQVFARLFDLRYPIASMTRVDAFDGSDERSMDANNCSSFNFRVIAGTERLSKHSTGMAIDINPIQNPWVRGSKVLPEAGREFLDRNLTHPALIRGLGPVVAAFAEIGWIWGGDWEAAQDYHHFELPD